MSKPTLFLLILFSAHMAFSEMDSGRFEMSEQGQAYWLPAWLSFNIFYDFKRHLIDVKAAQAPVAPKAQCRTSYQKIFNKSDIRWSVFFGYGDGDGDDHTTDFAERDLFEKEIQLPCPELNPEIQLCGFKREGDQPGQYVKQITNKDQFVVNIHLLLYNASLTSEMNVNLKEKEKEQRRKSKKIEKTFIESLHTEDILFYVGHARHGSGPGFRPLVRKSRDWWIATLFRPMVNNVMNSLDPQPPIDNFPQLKGNVNNPSIMGFFSCEAEAHYGAEMVRKSPETSLILTRQSISSSDNLRLLYAASNALLAQECDTEFQQSLKESITTVYYSPKKGPPESFEEKMPRFFNFFHKDKVKGRNDLLLYLEGRDEVEMEIPKNP